MTELQAGAAFDTIASKYDELWTRTLTGRLQRDAVWARVDPLIRPGTRILDLGCGTGEDALHFMPMSAEVRAIDASAEMVHVARTRGVDASILRIEDLTHLNGTFDLAISNFGALNCVSDLDSVSAALASLVNPGGIVAIGSLGRFCLWETLWYLLHARPAKAIRRFHSTRVASSLNVRVHHYSISQLRRAFAPHFRLLDWRGIGVFIPPSYVSGLSQSTLNRFGRIDRAIAHWPFFRAIADHRLLIFRRD